MPVWEEISADGKCLYTLAIYIEWRYWHDVFISQGPHRQYDSGRQEKEVYYPASHCKYSAHSTCSNANLFIHAGTQMVEEYRGNCIHAHWVITTNIICRVKKPWRLDCVATKPWWIILNMEKCKDMPMDHRPPPQYHHHIFLLTTYHRIFLLYTHHIHFFFHTF